MPTWTDYITALVLFYLFCQGWAKGMLRTILGPLSLIAGCLIAFGYYQKNHNIPTALAIAMLAPFAVMFLGSGIIALWRKASNSDIPPSTLSRAAASLLNAMWGGGYLALFILMIGLSPIRFGAFADVQDDVLGSMIFAYLDEKIDAKFTGQGYDIKRVADVLGNPEQLQAFQETEEFQALQDDERLKALYADEELAEMIVNKDYSGIIAHPKMRALFEDKELLKKIFALNRRIMEEGAEETVEDELDELPEEAPSEKSSW